MQRVTITIDDDLAVDLERFMAVRGYANRSEAIRDLARSGLQHGAAQVAGLRGATPHLSQMERRVERDLWYVDNWSMALDLKILVATVLVLLRLDAY